jgi:3-isopropylmalate/(R)-2-methylmalate dehydratase small subunit
MRAFDIETGRVAPMLAANIDTDVIMPKQFLKGIDRNGLGPGVFYDKRFLASGEPNPEFVLNQAPWRDAKFLVVGPNFGCGSSREHAVWGLRQIGIRALIGTSFAGIFFDNCQRNGLLTIQLDDASFAKFSKRAARPKLGDITINLPEQFIDGSGCGKVHFDINSLAKQSLLAGLDAIGTTLQRADAIQKFELRHLRENPWLK